MHVKTNLINANSIKEILERYVATHAVGMLPMRSSTAMTTISFLRSLVNRLVRFQILAPLKMVDAASTTQSMRYKLQLLVFNSFALK